MRKRIAFVLILAMLLTTVGAYHTPVRAEMTVDHCLEMTTSAISVNQGDAIEVTFHVHGLTTSGFSGYLDYDSNVLRLVSATPRSYLPNEVNYKETWSIWEHNYNANTGFLEVSLMESGNGANAVRLPTGSNDLLLTVLFEVRQSVAFTTISLITPEVKREEAWMDISYPEGLNLTIGNTRGKRLTIETRSVTGKDLITVPVAFVVNDGFTRLKLNVSYDESKLDFLGPRLANGLSDELMLGPTVLTGSGPTVATVDLATRYASYEYRGIGNIVFLEFRVVASTTGNTNNNKKPDAEPEVSPVVIQVISAGDQSGSAFQMSQAVTCPVTIIEDGQTVVTWPKRIALRTENVSGNSRIAVPVTLMANDGFTSLSISATFDTTRLAFDSASITNEFGSSVKLDNLVASQNGARLTMNLVAANELNALGTVMYLNFHALNPTTTGTTGNTANRQETTPVRLVVDYAADRSGNIFQYESAISSEVTITAPEIVQPNKRALIATEPIVGNSSIRVPLRLLSNDGFSDMEFTALYDAEMMVFDSVSIADDFANTVQLVDYATSQLGSRVKVTLKAQNETYAVGTLLYLNFHATTTAVTNPQDTIVTAVSITLDKGNDISGNQFKEEGPITSTVTITEKEHRLGDVNGNGTVDLVDILYVIQHYNLVRTLSAVEQKAADVNGSGGVDLIDARMILQYYNGERATLP